MCSEWKESFEAFYADMGSRPSNDYSIERNDNDKGYYKENCRWATRIEQANNRRSNVFYEYLGEKKTLSEWCRELNLDIVLTKKRIQYGWSFEEAANIKPRVKTCRLYELAGISKALPDWCKDLQLPYRTILSRIQKGMSFEKAILPSIENKLIKYDNVEKKLLMWCEMFCLDLRETCLKIIQGKAFEDIVLE